MRRWIAKTSAEGPGGYWCLYEGTPRRLVAIVCKFVTRWRGYLIGQHSPGAQRRSLSQDSAQAAARWVVKQLDQPAGKGAA